MLTWIKRRLDVCRNASGTLSSAKVLGKERLAFRFWFFVNFFAVFLPTFGFADDDLVDFIAKDLLGAFYDCIISA